MRLPRMTTRRWMITVVVTAILVRAAHGAERYRRIRARHAAALRGYKAAMLWYAEGRLDLVRSVLASERLLEAELALSSNQKDEATALSAHLERAEHLIEAERNEPFVLCESRSNREMWTGDAEATLVKWRARLKTMGGMQ